MPQKETQQSVTAWAEATFGAINDPKVLVDRARVELDELNDAVASGDTGDIGKETADVLILLYRLLEIHGLDADQQVFDKMQENRARRWRAKGDGTGSHIKG